MEIAFKVFHSRDKAGEKTKDEATGWLAGCCSDHQRASEDKEQGEAPWNNGPAPKVDPKQCDYYKEERVIGTKTAQSLNNEQDKEEREVLQMP